MRRIHLRNAVFVVTIFLMLANTIVANGDDAQLRAHFGEQQFSPRGGFVLRQGQALPPLVWAQPQLVATVVDEPTIPTRWFNERFEEVGVAAKTGALLRIRRSARSHGSAVAASNDVLLLGDRFGLEEVGQSNCQRNDWKKGCQQSTS